MGRTCGEPGEIKKNTHPKNVTALFLEQDDYTVITLLQDTFQGQQKRGVMFFGWVFFFDFVRRSGTTRAEGPHGGTSHVRGAKRNRVDHSRVLMDDLTAPFLSRCQGQAAQKVGACQGRSTALECKLG